MSDIHVLPRNDLREHEETRVCWCHPYNYSEPDDERGVVVVHHSADGRELVEEHGVN